MDTTVRVLDYERNLIQGYMVVFDNAGAGLKWSRWTDVNYTLPIEIRWCHRLILRPTPHIFDVQRDSVGLLATAECKRSGWLDVIKHGAMAFSVDLTERDEIGNYVREFRITEVSLTLCPACPPQLAISDDGLRRRLGGFAYRNALLGGFQSTTARCCAVNPDRALAYPERYI